MGSGQDPGIDGGASDPSKAQQRSPTQPAFFPLSSPFPFPFSPLVSSRGAMVGTPSALCFLFVALVATLARAGQTSCKNPSVGWYNSTNGSPCDQYQQLIQLCDPTCTLDLLAATAMSKLCSQMRCRRSARPARISRIRAHRTTVSKSSEKLVYER